jgi:ATP phosphoribosyltransferase
MNGTLRLLRSAGVPCPQEDGRRLLLEIPEKGLRFLFSRPSDVPVYVQYGAADLGICGKDTLIEMGPKVYEVLDLGFGAGRFVLATVSEWVDQGFDWTRPGLRVATKFPRIASLFLESQGASHHIIKVHGAAELAPRVGLAEMVFDITATGKTLAENGLRVVANAGTTTARLVANPASYKVKARELGDVIARVKGFIQSEGHTLAGL